MSERVETASKNIVWSLVNKGFAIILPFITQTILLYCMGIEYIGLNSLFTSVLSMLSLAELGFGSALVFSMYKPIAEGNVEKVCALLQFYKKCYRMIGIIVLAIGLVLLPFMDRLSYGECPRELNVYYLYLIYLANTVISYFMFAYKTSLLNACQRVDLVSNVSTIANLLKTILQCIGIFLFRNYYIFALMIPFLTIVNNLMMNYLTNKYYPQYQCRGKLDTNTLASIKEKVLGLMFQKIGSVVLTSVDSVIISAFLGLSILGKYNNYYYIMNAVAGIVGAVLAAITPVIGNSIAVESKEKNYRDFQKFLFMHLLMVSWCSICLMCLYEPFMELWAGKQNMLPKEMVLLFTMYFYFFKCGDMSHVYKEAAGIWWAGKFVPILAAGVNLSLNIFLIQRIGIAGVVLSTLASLIFVYIPMGSWVLFHNYFDYKYAWGKYLYEQLKGVVITALIGGITFFLCEKVPYTGVLAIIMRGILCMVIPTAFYTLLFYHNTYFKDLILLGKQRVFKYIKK